MRQPDWAAIDVDSRLIERVYRSIFRIRWVEERIVEIYHTDKIKSPIHLSIGQEAPSVGVCEALQRNDIVFGTYRGHALYLAKGGNLNAMVAELYGKATGCGKGKAGSMHLGDPDAGIMGTSAIVGTTIPQAVGYAFAEKLREKKTVVAVCFGDGAMEEGVFHESMNFASLMKLPVVFVCENNFYAIFTPLEKRVPKTNFCERAEVSYGIPARKINNNDALETFRAVQDAAAAARAGRGPTFIEVETYRWREHVGPNEDWQLGYRSYEEVKSWMDRDELKRIGGMLSPARRASIEAEVQKEVDAAFDFAERSPFPSPDELHNDVFTN
jgi:TPP-dependent pyruvate/acetoin dehydrogenase alpha subunit